GGVERDVPRCRGQRAQALEFVADANEQRPPPAAPVAQKGKGTIVETTAHAESGPGCVERNERYQHNVEEAGGGARVRADFRLGYAETVVLHPCIRRVAMKLEVRAAQSRQEDALAAHPRVLDDGVQWDLTAGREVGGNCPGALVGEKAG